MAHKPMKPKEPMRRFRLTVAYDGTCYSGWQTQARGIGVQQKLEEALGHLFPPPVVTHSSSRTDAGVHALGMVVHFEVPREQFRMPVAKLILAVNAHLPEDIRVMSARLCQPSFHARFSARGKEYRYFIWNHAAMNPLCLHQAWHVPQNLDWRAMQAACRHLLGRHDFRAFAANRNYPFHDTVRTLCRCALQRHGPMITVRIEGDGFLYKMCRGVVGTLVQIGQGKLAADEIPAILASRDRRVAGMTAPAHGLVLWKVKY
jgi:tRNA pseudouridine38-40 synthase